MIWLFVACGSDPQQDTKNKDVLEDTAENIEPSQPSTEPSSDTAEEELVEECGNGIIEPGEACDDGNISNADGCSENCVVEVCGDSLVNASLIGTSTTFV